MKSHGIQFVGKLWIQNVPTLPVWSPQDVARVIFVEDENVVYVGGTVSYGNWIGIGHAIRDIGSGIDPESGVAFNNRLYMMRAENGHLVLEYEESE